MYQRNIKICQPKKHITLMTFAPWVVNSNDKEVGKVPRSAKGIVFENFDLTSSFITTNDPLTQYINTRMG